MLTTLKNRRVELALGIWFIVALVLGASGRVALLRPPAPQILIVSLTALCLAAVFVLRSVREWANAVPIESLVALHVTRFVGFYFLYLANQGRMAREFAVLAGWGDIVVAVGALILLTIVPPPYDRALGIARAWNVFGLADILFVVATATRIALRNPESMQELLRYPLSLLPTFLVPLIIVSHVLLFWRLRRANV